MGPPLCKIMYAVYFMKYYTLLCSGTKLWSMQKLNNMHDLYAVGGSTHSAVYTLNVITLPSGSSGSGSFWQPSINT